MATVFMKWLETRPRDYDRGINLLTLGCLKKLKQKIADEYIQSGDNVLEIGCGTGTLTLLMAEKGAQVKAIDASPAMLAEAEEKVKSVGLGDQIELHNIDAVMIEEVFPDTKFDLIVSTLAFSEMLISGNMAWKMYSGLTESASLTIEAHASDELKQRYLPKMVSGEWAGTMCLTEAHAGSDLGILRTKAEPLGDGSYAISGTKIFITAGEHQISSGIRHANGCCCTQPTACTCNNCSFAF